MALTLDKNVEEMLKGWTGEVKRVLSRNNDRVKDYGINEASFGGRETGTPKVRVEDNNPFTVMATFDWCTYDGKGEFQYSRKIAPYGHDGDNVLIIANLLPIVDRCARNVGLARAAFEHDGRISGMHPALTFGGYFREENFGDVLRLLETTENLADLYARAI